MEFLPLSRRRSSSRNVPGGEERGETDVFAVYFKGLFKETKENVMMMVVVMIDGTNNVNLIIFYYLRAIKALSQLNLIFHSFDQSTKLTILHIGAALSFYNLYLDGSRKFHCYYMSPNNNQQQCTRHLRVPIHRIFALREQYRRRLLKHK